MHQSAADNERTVSTGGLYEVWWASIADLQPAHLGLLSRIEMERRARYLRSADQDRFSLGAVLLRLAVASVTGARPEGLHVDRTCPRCSQAHGRPRLDDPAIEVSISHSGDVVVAAVGGPEHIGVDVEQIRRVNSRQLAALVSAPNERLHGLSDESFLRHWTRKEAVLKATGDGLRTALRDVALTKPTEPPELLSYEGRPGLRARLDDLHPPPGYVATLAVLGEGGRLVERDAGNLLAI